MQKPKPSFLDRLKEGYEVAKKPIAYIIMFIALLLQSLPPELMPESSRDITYTVMILILALILFQILFVIYENSIKGKKKLNIIGASELYNSILGIVLKEKNVSIKYIGVAGRIGWTNVLAKLINESNPDSLVSNRTKFNIDVALLDPKIKDKRHDLYERFEAVNTISKDVLSASVHLSEIAVPGSELNLYHYDYMPNMLGFLVNDNYLYVTYAFWEQLHGKLTLRAGGTDYFVYDKNDDYGGQEIIRRFTGWYNFIIENEKVNKSNKD
jgi:hypothetical protein